ncbi:MAG: energy-coupling factor transporter transmembrane protein EcfT [Ruminococcaceae bacterium]|nr:energy-coupling factor transporter transmembrane protein EcfT [Oscillospiraceae bacterium]
MALKDITLGQYFPGNSPLHRMDPRTKLMGLVLYIVALFLAKSVLTYGIMFAVLATLIAISRVPLKSILQGMKPVVFILVFTAALNLLYTPGKTVLWSWWILTVTLEGVRTAIFMVLRIVMLISATFLLTYTTSPILLTDGIERLLRPLKLIRVPVHELAMMMSIALRFIPTLIEETDKIMSAQRARGADFESGSLIRRAKALIPLLVPLFISAFRRADELAVAMECRCYHGGDGRTRMRQLKLRALDWVTLVLALLLCVGIFVLGRLNLYPPYL